MEQHESADLPGRVKWIAAAGNPFGVELLDCSDFAGSMLSSTANPDVADRFTRLRQANGEHCRGTEPVIPIAIECRLEYPFDGHQDGPLFKAQRMEEKWDVYLFDAALYFTRSWTGDLAYKASFAREHGRGIVTMISHRDLGGSEDPVAVVDFLIKSHVYGVVAPHPLPRAPELQATELAVWSFAWYGRRGRFGTRSDVTHFPVVRSDDGQYSLGIRLP
jgi:hypothetical protein